MFTIKDRLTNAKKVQSRILRVKRPDPVKEQVKDLLQKDEQKIILMVRG